MSRIGQKLAEDFKLALQVAALFFSLMPVWMSSVCS
jgi:hypothetical protein